MSVNNYTESDISVLEGLEAVRKRPGMYIGNTKKAGLHHLIWEILDNSVDEAFYCISELKKENANKILVEYFKEDNIISIQDFGRGIPVGKHPKMGISTVEVVFTVLHAGGKFNKNVYKTSGGLHGVGASVTNALSRFLEVEVCRDGKKYYQKYEKGKPLNKLKEIGECKESGTKVYFSPDPEIFKEEIKFDLSILKNRLKEIAFLNKRITFELKVYNNIDERKLEESFVFHYPNGLYDFIISEVKKENLIFDPILFSGKEFDVDVEVAFSWDKTSFKNNIKSFVNNIKTIEGGSHEIGFITAIYNAINQKMKENGFNNFDKIKQEDIKEGLIAAISVRVAEPEFEGQTKNKLNNSEARKAVFKIVKDSFYQWLEENPKTFKEIVKKIETAQKARESAQKAREMIRKTDLNKDIGVLPSKLADCQSRNPEECELFLVEGDSAGGSAKQARDRRTQAILPLKGKVLNVMKVDSRASILKHSEIGALITALGCGIEKDFNLEKLRYHKIIIMTDADVDGSHISFLLLLLFFKMFRPLVENGNIYLAVPPLFRAKKSDKVLYFADQEELEKYFRKEANDFDSSLDDLTKGWVITRFKGLGEMNPEQLQETAMNPETRRVVQVKTNPENIDEISYTLELLGGKNSNFRGDFLLKYTSEAENIDI